MATFVAELEPRILWSHFDRLLATPRPSKKEEAARAYVLGVAAARGLTTRADAAGNVVVVKRASPGRERAPIVVLQSHLDMVGEKNADVAFDFDRDAIVPRRDGEWLRATGTTLGADNGIGAAAMLAVAESTELEHGPLELLFTVEEEIGLLGAMALDPALVAGRIVLNLDTEAERALYIGCAGGAGGEIALPLDSMFGADGRVALAIRLSGLKGGHSGAEIHLQRGNSIRLLARALESLWSEYRFEMAEFSGGNLPNAIPREASALVRVTRDERAGFERALEAALEAAKQELAAVDPDLAWEVVAADEPRQVWSDDTTGRVLALLAALPHGVERMSDDLPGLVESSSNLARVRCAEGELRVTVSNRSSVATALAALQRRIEAFARLAGGAAEVKPGYPGWKPNLASPTLAVLRRVVERDLGAPPQLLAIHAGLECGILSEKLPGSDLVSFGPTIEGAHSPDERVHIPTVERFWRLLADALRELAA